MGTGCIAWPIGCAGNTGRRVGGGYAPYGRSHLITVMSRVMKFQIEQPYADALLGAFRGMDCGQATAQP